ncbi:MAG: SDR family NAD(P)-dependent oxidoreductase, partial [Alphaproteobacteria bacterium]|nr:SDR family NAD(P)-dependent oxidoreductase [Alphaproteobacteria bacterium]
MSYRGILITGASSGIGAALALELARPGIVLGLMGRDSQRLAAIADQARARGAECRAGQFDLRDQTAMQDFVRDFAALSPIDLVIANAGVLDGRRPDGALETAEAARQLLEINLLTTIDVFHLMLPHVRATRGQILLVASLAGLAPLPDAPAYSASKAGLISYG